MFGQRKTVYFPNRLSRAGPTTVSLWPFHSFSTEMGDEIEYFHGTLHYTLTDQR